MALERPGSLEQGYTPEEALRNFNRFIGQMWLHSLVTEETLRQRREAKVELELTLNDPPGTPDYIAIPYGSTLWIPDMYSDFDYIILTDNPILKGELETMNLDLLFHYHLDISCFTYDQLEERLLQADKPEPDFLKMGLLLLITPDDLISGDIALIRAFRLKILHHLRNPDLYRVMNTYFKKIIASWGLLPNNIPTRTPRSERFRNALASRSSQSKKPYDYIDRFTDAAFSASLPNPDIIEKALNLSKGAVVLDPKYAAVGTGTPDPNNSPLPNLFRPK